jgi:hypothetical protein
VESTNFSGSFLGYKFRRLKQLRLAVFSNSCFVAYFLQCKTKLIALEFNVPIRFCKLFLQAIIVTGPMGFDNGMCVAPVIFIKVTSKSEA